MALQSLYGNSCDSPVETIAHTANVNTAVIPLYATVNQDGIEHPAPLLMGSMLITAVGLMCVHRFISACVVLLSISPAVDVRH